MICSCVSTGQLFNPGRLEPSDNIFYVVLLKLQLNSSGSDLPRLLLLFVHSIKLISAFRLIKIITS